VSRDQHESAVLHASGAALYTHDLALRAGNALHAWPVTSAHARARVLSIDARAALSLPGVHAVLTADDVPGENDTGPVRHDEPLFPQEAKYHGQPVAWVLAETEDQARAAADEVQVGWEPLPALTTLAQAVHAESYHTDARCIEHGAVDLALADAPHTLAGELEVGGQEHFYLEMQAAFAMRDESGEILVHASTQHPTETQVIVAQVLGVSAHRVVCQVLRMGGGFGGKETQANLCAAVAALGVLKTGRPVSVRLDRRRDMTITGKRHPFQARFRVGFEPDGRVVALVAELVSDGGYSLDLSEAIMWRAMFHIDNCYAIPNLRVSGRVAATHLPSNTAMRGFGGPQGMVIIEDIMDRVARSLGMAPELVRERNFYRPSDLTHYGQTVRHAERIERIWSELKRDSEYVARRAATDAFNASHRHLKRGLAITPVKFGISFTATFFNQAGALVLVYRDGSVQLNHGGTEMGQGLHTKMRLVAARALGVALDSVRIMPTRTDKVPNTSATAASSGADLNGAAIQAACEELRARLTPFAAELLGCAESEVRFHEGRASCAGSTHTLPFAQVVERAYMARVPLFAAGHYRTPNIHFDPQGGRGEPFHYFAYGAAVSEVEVDGFSGQYTLRRVDILHDVGDSLAPSIDRGQIEGGFIQGLGWLTCEELRFSDQGALLTRGASTYKLPGIGECPPEFHVRTLERATEPSVVYGSKAVGEPPFMLAISVREALRDAVAAFGQADSEVVELAVPATPEAVFWAIQRLRGSSARS
jgi:xanthine dehydrogenase large subunit